MRHSLPFPVYMHAFSALLGARREREEIELAFIHIRSGGGKKRGSMYGGEERLLRRGIVVGSFGGGSKNNEKERMLCNPGRNSPLSDDLLDYQVL